MPTSYKTPGVYIEEIPKFPPSVAQVETAIPAFIGYTQQAKRFDVDDLLRTPTRIKSMAEYTELFGGPPKQAFEVVVNEIGADPNKRYEPVVVNTLSPSGFRMFHAMRMFFANGGGPCYIVSVGNYTSTIAATDMGLNDGNGGLDKIRKVDEVTLLVFPDAPAIPGSGNTDALKEADSNSKQFGLYNSALQQAAHESLMDRFVIMDMKDGNLDKVTEFRNASLDLDKLKYGAAYFPWLKTIYNYDVDDNSVTLVLPDSANDADTDPDKVTITALLAEAAPNGRGKFITPLFRSKLMDLINRNKVVLPPSAAIAGLYASVDSTRGVWKAPANVTVSDTIEPTFTINDEDQRDMNVHDTGKSVNAIRAFTGLGTLVWGARTLMGNDNEWRYISVRRLFNMVEESVKKASRQFVFEPNDANTWVRVRAMIENFLFVLWRQGAMAGAKPEHAFYVKVGLPDTMTPLDILEGRMIVEIGMAAVRPAEFIILRFSHKMQES
ncbi:MAG: phage tail sheath family protein [Saprospiraceae bacterium]